MSSEIPESYQRESVERIYRFAAQRLKAGDSNYKVERALMQQGLDQRSAMKVVSDLTTARKRAVRSGGQKDMTIGCLICVVGIVVTIATYSAASSSPTGGSYVIAWGAIIFGAIQFFRGVSNSGR